MREYLFKDHDFITQLISQYISSWTQYDYKNYIQTWLDVSPGEIYVQTIDLILERAREYVRKSASYFASWWDQLECTIWPNENYGLLGDFSYFIALAVHAYILYLTFYGQRAMATAPRVPAPLCKIPQNQERECYHDSC